MSALHQNGHRYNDNFVCDYCRLGIVEIAGRHCEAERTPEQVEQSLDDYAQNDAEEL